ncbi:hypothetical protein AAG570_004027 [Ranatra chinensis]|uniref:Saposin B-type domain-containing protein n=1 Tax=Ranatra chinensis TaxID=642074 RepID=A0ABD0Y2L7_9HEMI
MVKQARDQLESNETQTDIKTVLEASCKVIPMHVVREDCIKLMDDFAADLIDTLASQMNPQVVCSVAGLCNNNRVHRLEEEYYRNLCGHAGSYSDSCASVVTIYKDEIQAFLLKNANSAGNNVCSLVGVCKEKYHNHKNGLVRVPISHDSVSTVRLEDGDVACDFCVQMVGHLRDILIANSSKDTFKLVLTGICNQMTAYKEECLHLVSEYYEVMYDFLVEELNGPVLCKMVGLCHPSSGQNIEVHLRPLIYTNTETVLKVGKHVGNNKKSK